MNCFKKFYFLSAIALIASFPADAKLFNKSTPVKVENKGNISNILPRNIFANLPETLKLCIRSALTNNKEIQSEKSNLIAAHEDFNIARSDFLPKINANGALSAADYQIGSVRNTSSKEGLRQRIGGGEYRSEANIGITQNLYKGGADIGRLAEVEKTIQAKGKGFEKTVQTVIRTICETYFDVITKSEEMELLKAWIASGQENIRVASDMLNAGTVKEMDVAQAQAGLAETEARMSKVEAEYKSSLAKLEELIGAPVPPKLSSSKVILNQKLTASQALRIAEQLSPQLLESEALYQAAKAALKKPNAELSPSLDLSTKYGANKTRRLGSTSLGDSQLNYGPSVELTVSFPIFSGGRGVSQKRQYSEIVTKSAVDKQRAYERVKTEVVSTLERLEAAEETIISANVAIEARSKALQSTQEEFRAGTKIMNDVLEAERKVFEAKTTLAEAVQERLKQQCVLLGLIGALNPELIGMKDLMFDYNTAFAKQKRTAMFYKDSANSDNRKS